MEHSICHGVLFFYDTMIIIKAIDALMQKGVKLIFGL